MKRPILALVTLAAAVLVACGDGGEGGAASSSDHNEADVAFARGMVPHHEQAVGMARLAATRAQDPRVKELATRIEVAQDPEIGTMTGWLDAWGEEAEGAGGGHTGMGETSGSEEMGVASEDDLARLEAASGAGFDRAFLAAMTEHHRGAIEMAETELAEGRFGDAKALATRIRDGQRAEVEEMGRLLVAVPA